MKTTFLTIAILVATLSSKLNAQCYSNSGSYNPSNINYGSSGNAELDNDVAVFVTQLNQLLSTNAGYCFYDDSKNMNAYASQADGNIHIGLNMASSCFHNGTGLTGLYYVIAHEMGHIYQFNHKNGALLNYGGIIKYGELQADFMAGYELARLNYINGNNYNQLLSQVWVMGDPTGGWQRKDAHGTFTERQMDVKLGLEQAANSADEAFAASMKIIPPDPSMVDRPVAEIDFLDNTVLYILYGGRVVDQYNNQVGQMSNEGRINFTKEGDNDVIIDSSQCGEYNGHKACKVYNGYNVIVGAYLQY